MLLFFGKGEGRVCLIVAVMVVCSGATVRILLVFCCLYVYQICTIMFINANNVCLLAYIVKKIEVVMPLNYTFILDKRMNMFFPVPTIGNTMELSSIRVSL
jgi:hypothetical protein